MKKVTKFDGIRGISNEMIVLFSWFVQARSIKISFNCVGNALLKLFFLLSNIRLSSLMGSKAFISKNQIGFQSTHNTFDHVPIF